MLMLITAISKTDQREGEMTMLPDSTMWTSLFSDVGTNHITSPGKLFLILHCAEQEKENPNVSGGVQGHFKKPPLFCLSP